ncbi:energy-coupled thiamine transporter ThiT [Alkalicella caledoniensis]|uniref:Energy-coupled thiamine transporter ThiT n=1 Tax=Alkalicella caledoniensis TaxID=2731377 RepID=A0A7G9WCE1_ALKCA|nr:energy-coupled thiamine transporter ThiT [Alkalicella caledoniensis]QNO16353.1 energy-coupled thiamine transporter ThiT [Alkalicella caledoniensis]
MNRNQTKIVVETGIMLALAFILSYFRVGKMPQGGSVSLQMIPIFLIALRWGFKPGIIAGVAFGLLKMLGPDFWFAHYAQIFLDYILAFAVIGFAGLFRNNYIVGIILAGFLRFFSHFLAGFIFFAEYAPDGMHPVIYSLGYNATYMIPEIVLVILITPLVVQRLKNMPVQDTKFESIVALAFAVPLLTLTAFTGRFDSEIYQLIAQIVTVFAWVVTLLLSLMKMTKEQNNTPLIILINTQVVVILGYLIINYFLN